MSSSLHKYLEDLADEDDISNPPSPNSKSFSTPKHTTAAPLSKPSNQFPSPTDRYKEANKSVDGGTVSRKSIFNDLEIPTEEKFDSYLPADNYDVSYCLTSNLPAYEFLIEVLKIEF